MKSKHLKLILAILLLSSIATAQMFSPFPVWLSKLWGSISISPDGRVNPPSVETEGLALQKTAVFEYDVAQDTGTIAAHTLGVYLPAGAVITRSWLQILTPFTSGASGGGTVALSCEDANNIKTATDLSGSADSALIEGASTGAASAYTSSIAAACQITATVAGTAQTAGKLRGWANYVIGDY